MSADQFVLLFGCLFGRDLPGAGTTAGQPAAPAEPPPALAPSPAGPLILNLPPVKFGLAKGDNAPATLGGETPVATPSTPPAATPVTLPQRPVELYAAAGATHIQYAGAASPTTWRSFTLGAVAPLRRSALTLEGTAERRSGTTDTRISAQFDSGLGPHLSGYVAVAGTPAAHFRESWSLAGGLDWALGQRLGLTLDARHATYATGSFTSVSPALRVTPRAVPLEVSAKWINLWDSTGRHWQGWSLKAAYDLSDRARLVAGYAAYPDVEAGVARTMRSAYAGATVPLGDRLTLRLTVNRDSREGSYTGSGVMLALSWRLKPRGG
jgi:YaiO family outer membrane protein